MQVKEQQLKLDMEQQSASTLEKEYVKAVYCHPAYLTSNAMNIMQIAWLHKTQTGFKIGRRNINNFRYADDTTLMAESKEELNSLLMKLNEESEKVSLKLNIQEPKIMACCPITHDK